MHMGLGAEVRLKKYHRLFFQRSLYRNVFPESNISKSEWDGILRKKIPVEVGENHFSGTISPTNLSLFGL